MSKDLQNLLSKTYAPAVPRKLSFFPTRDQLPLANWFAKIPVGTNYALQILENLQKLSTKEEKGASQILREVLMVLSEDDRHPKELGKRVRDSLQIRLNPQSESCPNLYENLEKGIDLEEGIRLRSTRISKVTTFTLETKFKRVEELKIKLERILDSLNSEEWKKLEKL